PRALRAGPGVRGVPGRRPRAPPAPRRYLGRLPELTPGARAELGERISVAVRAQVSPPPPAGTPAPAYLGAVLAERHRREQARLTAPGAPGAGPTPAPPGGTASAGAPPAEPARAPRGPAKPASGRTAPAGTTSARPAPAAPAPVSTSRWAPPGAAQAGEWMRAAREGEDPGPGQPAQPAE